MYRTRTCGDLRLADEGLVITAAGWVQKTRKMGGMTVWWISAASLRYYRNWCLTRKLMLLFVRKQINWDANMLFR